MPVWVFSVCVCGEVSHTCLGVGFPIFQWSIWSSYPNNKDLEWLDIPNNNLKGTFPYEFGLLTSIQGISLPNNNLTGKIPGVIGLLKNLLILDLSGNDFSGTLPGELHLLSNNLETLYLSEWVNVLIAIIPNSFIYHLNLRLKLFMKFFITILIPHLMPHRWKWYHWI